MRFIFFCQFYSTVIPFGSLPQPLGGNWIFLLDPFGKLHILIRCAANISGLCQDENDFVANPSESFFNENRVP